jgi:hypothetical protein
MSNPGKLAALIFLGILVAAEDAAANTCPFVQYAGTATCRTTSSNGTTTCQQSFSQRRCTEWHGSLSECDPQGTMIICCGTQIFMPGSGRPCGTKDLMIRPPLGVQPNFRAVYMPNCGGGYDTMWPQENTPSMSGF